MATNRVMYDAITPSNIPKDAQIVASYVSGQWPNFSQLKDLFPNARYISIATNDSAAAMVLDVERFDATPEQAPPWVSRMRAAGMIAPWVYMNSSTWPAVRQAFHNQAVKPPLYWVADYSQTTIPDGAIALQYQNTPEFDISYLVDYIPGFDTDGEQYNKLRQGEDMLALVEVDKDDCKANKVRWPGIFMTDGFKIRHVAQHSGPVSNVAAWLALGVGLGDKTISVQEFRNLGGKTKKL